MSEKWALVPNSPTNSSRTPVKTSRRVPVERSNRSQHNGAHERGVEQARIGPVIATHGARHDLVDGEQRRREQWNQRGRTEDALTRAYDNEHTAEPHCHRQGFVQPDLFPEEAYRKYRHHQRGYGSYGMRVSHRQI